MKGSLAILACVAAIAVPRIAAAKPHVAVLPIVDDNGSELLDAVSAAVEDDVSLTTMREITHTMDKLRLGDELSDRDLQKLVTELEVDALVRGVAEKEGAARVLHIRVYAFGKRSHGFSIHFGNAKSPKFKRAFRDALIGKLAQLNGSDDAHGKPRKHDDRDEDVGADNDPDGNDHDDDPLHPNANKAKHAVKTATGGSGDASGDDDKGDDSGDDSGDGGHKHKKRAKHGDGSDGTDGGSPAVIGSLHSFHHVVARADLGVSVLTRSFTFNSTAFAQAPKPYSQSPVPGIRFSGELYPFGTTDPTAASAGLGLAAAYDQTLQLSLRTPTQPETPLPATQRHWSVGLRYRLSLGHLPTSATLTFGIDYGGREFVVDRTPLMGGAIDLPDVDYTIVEPGVAFRLPLGRAVALTVSGRYLLVSSAGAVSDPAQYGPGSVYGVEGDVGLEFALGQHVAFRLAGEFTQIAFSFDGTGAMANDRDGNPGTVDVFGATDRYIGGVATFAVLY
jgi:hypothetical protein